MRSSDFCGIAFFVTDMDTQIKTQLQKLGESGPLDGLIIDLRTNGGGFTNVILRTLGLLIDGGSIGSDISRDSKSEETIIRTAIPPLFQGIPIVILTSRYTFSGGEVFAVGMQFLKRARIVGTPSGGNTDATVRHDFPDGSYLWLTEKSFRLPDGTSIQGRGVQPDRVVEL